MPLRLEPRATASGRMLVLSPLLALGLTLLLATGLFVLQGKPPLTVLQTLFVAPLNSLYGWGELAVKAAPLLLIALGLAVGFRANVWNIGAEGQFTMGAISGGGLALAFPDLHAPWLLLAMALAGGLGGALWAAIPAWLRTHFNANEILTSLMLSYVAVLLLGYLTHGPWRDPAGYNFPESAQFSAAATLPVLFEGTRMHPGILVALLAALLIGLVLTRSFFGFQVRVAGLDPAAARYAGFRQGRLIWSSFLISGALAGLAGLFEVAGPIGQLRPEISPGYGFAAIIVAFMGRLHPLGITLAALLMALLYLGGETAQSSLGLPLALTGVFQGMLLFFLLAFDVLIHYRLRKVQEVR